MSGEGFVPVELAPGLWRWTAIHPEWQPGAAEGSTGDWGPRVGAVLASIGGATAFFDALVPADEGAFWRWADREVGRGERCAALTTIGFHRRSRERLVARYGAETSRARGRLPVGVEKVSLRGAGEVSYWLPEHRALIVGDRLLGDGAGGVRLCPESWLRYLGNGFGHADLRERMRPLLELPVERVLVSHGEPVLSDGRAAIAAALA